MTRRVGLRRWFFLGVAGAVALACGLDIAGTVDFGPNDGAPDAQADAPGKPSDTTPPDGSPLPDGATPPDGGVPACVPDGGFCDYCDRDLVLCIQFDGGIVDESRYRRHIDFDGSAPKLRDDNGFGFMELDGKVVLTMPAGEGLFDLDAFSFEVLARLGAKPAAGKRFAFYDRPGSSSMFLYGAENGGGPYVRCNGIDSDAGSLDTKWMHFACVSNARADGGDIGDLAVYIDGGPISADGLSSDRPKGTTATTFLFSNDPDGADGWVGDIATVRIYKRKRTPREIANAAGAP